MELYQVFELFVENTKLLANKFFEKENIFVLIIQNLMRWSFWEKHLSSQLKTGYRRDLNLAKNGQVENLLLLLLNINILLVIKTFFPL